KVSVIPFIKRIQHLEPWPYAKHCFAYRDYRLDLRPDELDQNALQGSPNVTTTRLELYRSRGECFLYCMWRALNAHRCANLFSIFTFEMVQQEQFYRFTEFTKEITKVKMQGKYQKQNEYSGDDKDFDEMNINYDDGDYWVKFCPRSYRSYKAYLKTRRRCLKRCPPACTIETYAEEGVYDYQPDSKTNASLVEVVWASKPTPFVHHHPKMDRDEFIGSIGGHA